MIISVELPHQPEVFSLLKWSLFRGILPPILGFQPLVFVGCVVHDREICISWLMKDSNPSIITGYPD